MAFPPIQFRRMNHVRGPNLWTWVPVNEVWVDLGILEDHPSDTIPGYYERLVEWLPGLSKRWCRLIFTVGPNTTRFSAGKPEVTHFEFCGSETGAATPPMVAMFAKLISLPLASK